MDFYDVKTAEGYRWGTSGPVTRPWGRDINIVIQKPDGTVFSVLCSWKKETFSIKDAELLARVNRLILNEQEQSAMVNEKTYGEKEITDLLKEKGYLEEGQTLDDLPDKISAEK